GGALGSREQSFGKGAAAGAAGVQEDLRQQDENKFGRAERQFANQQEVQRTQMEQERVNLEKSRFSQQQIMDAAQLEHLTKEELLSERSANLKDREELAHEEESSQQMQVLLADHGADLATIPNNGLQGNGSEMMKDFIAHPDRFKPPEGFG